jgi:uncharacterized MnhB-related membrane protein
MTPLDIVTLSLRNSGVLGTGRTADADMTNTVFKMLNSMLAQWAVKRWLVYHLVNVSIPSTGAVSYTVGQGGAFNMATRPSEIDAAFVSQNLGRPDQIDTPLSIIEAREDYNRIAMKGLVSFPYILYYDNAYPLGSVYFWPAPNATQYGITITAKMVLSAFTSLTQDINLPGEYQEALIYNLAMRVCVLYQLDLDAAIVALAKAALGTIRAANTQIPMLQMPPQLGRGARYNVYSDQGR